MKRMTALLTALALCPLLLMSAAAGEEEKKRDKLNMAVDALRSRYGTKAVVRGRLFEGGSGDHEAEAIQAERAEAHRIRERR